MHLKNFPKVRVREYLKGYVVEIQLKKWYGKKYWKHIISVSGIDNQPWFYSKKETAINEAKRYFEYDLIVNSNEG